MALYVNFKQRKEWLSTDKQWDMEGIIHYELLERNLTVTAIKQKLPGRQRGVILQNGDARSHTANTTKAAIQELDWEILPHPPYSPDLAPSGLPPLPLSLQQSARSFLQQRR
jgi:hypothetical protein